LGLIAVLCALNAMRRASDRILGSSLEDWFANVALSFSSGLVVAILVALSVVATYNRAPPAWRVRVPALIVAIVVSSIVGDMILFTMDSLGRYDFEGFGGPIWAFVGTWPRHVLLAFLLTAVLLHVRIADDSEAATRRAELDRARFAQQEDEARLQALHAQIEPHFLFNTLANVRRLYAKDPPAGDAMLGDLMAYFAVALPQMRATDSTLGREAALTEAYLGLQQIRMGSRLAFDIDIAEPLHTARVPPMMLLTLAENAIKHGLAPLPEGGHVRVSADVVAGQLRIRVADSGAGFAESSGGGTGLANIRARLASLYADAAELTIGLNEPRGVVATIALPHAVAEPAARTA
jgi:signal transduction histidine kinase